MGHRYRIVHLDSSDVSVLQWGA